MQQKNEKEIEVNGRLIRFDISIKKIIEYSDLFVVMIREEKEIPNNIIAYDYLGNKLWSINDIIQAKIPRGFNDIEKVSDRILQADYDLGIIYEIDIKDRMIKSKTYLR